MRVLATVLEILVELMWSVPLLGLIVLIARWSCRCNSRRGFTLLVCTGSLLGIPYSIALSLIAGPMVSAVIIPLLPFMATIGAFAGFLASVDSREESLAARNIYIVFALIACVWIAYDVLARQIASDNAVSLVIVKRVPTTGVTRWDGDDQFIALNKTERTRVQESLGAKSGSILTPVLFLEEGKNPNVEVILIMTHDVRGRIRFSIPDSGVEILRQNDDDTWQSDRRGAHMGKSSLGLSPAESGFTRIEIAGQFGTESSEVQVSHE